MESVQTTTSGAQNISYAEIQHDTAGEANKSGAVRAPYLFNEHSLEALLPRQIDKAAGRVILMSAIKMAGEKYQLAVAEGRPMAVKEAVQHANMSVAQNTGEFQEKLKESAAKASKAQQLFQQSQQTYEAAQQGFQPPHLSQQNSPQPQQNSVSSQSHEVDRERTPDVVTHEKNQSKVEEKNAKQQQQASIALAKQRDGIDATQQDQEKKKVLEQKQQAHAMAQHNESKAAVDAV